MEGRRREIYSTENTGYFYSQGYLKQGNFLCYNGMTVKDIITAGRRKDGYKWRQPLM
jgi:hypothetical protein